jgi:hypothetical protein
MVRRDLAESGHQRCVWFSCSSNVEVLGPSNTWPQASPRHYVFFVALLNFVHY